MATIATPHHPWCDESDCYIHRGDGHLVHVGHESIVEAGLTIVGVALTEAGEGVEVRLALDSGITTKSATLDPDTARELSAALAEYAEVAVRLSAAAE